MQDHDISRCIYATGNLPMRGRRGYMPVFRVVYRVKGAQYENGDRPVVCVQAKSAEAAATAVRTYRAAEGEVAIVDEIEKLGSLIGMKAAQAAPGASWVSRDGKIRALAKMRVRNLRRLERDFANCAFGTGFLSALREELDRRGEAGTSVAV